MTTKDITYATPLPEGAALNGGEYFLAMQGGNPVWLPVTGGGDSSSSGTYAPTLVASAGTAFTRGVMGAGPLGFSRVGEGAGSTYMLFGAVVFAGAADGATIDLPLDVPISASPFPLIEVIDTIDTAAVITGEITSFTNVRFTLVSDGADDGGFTFRITYQASA